MKKLRFKCTLLSDIIINQKAATEGNQETLDFIPGNNFLGIAAGVLYQKEVLTPEEQLAVFHSGKVRFGDAHPSSHNSSVRSVKAPLSMAKPKIEAGDPLKNTYILHHPEAQNKENKAKQLKSYRTGFYTFTQHQGVKVITNKSFAIKSAYDAENRRSKDAQMYGYESIDKGTEFLFEVEIDNELSDQLTEKIKQALIGDKKRIGRSRTAQYGLVKIEVADFEEVQTDVLIDEGIVYVYADGRLIFLDDSGTPVFTPTVEQLGFESGEATICWKKTQIRTFQYAPWNSIRQSRDTDRCGIEKGSVFAVNTKKGIPHQTYIGSYRNEGFGKVFYNPAFLTPKEDGTAAWPLMAESDNQPSAKFTKEKQEKTETKNDTLLEFLVANKEKQAIELTIYESVNQFVEKNKDRFKEDRFASQWGTIRSIATQYTDDKVIKNKLFAEKTGYLTHGVAKDKWDKRGRRDILKKYIDSAEKNTVQLHLINLAAAMAKAANNK